jgi:hypothetical protein
MKETSWMRITVTSSLNEISTDQVENKMVVSGGGGRRYSALIPFYKQASGQIFNDDVNGISSTLDICLMGKHGVKKRCRLSLLTNSALVI